MVNIVIQEGFVGLFRPVNGTIDNCINEGEVINDNIHVGGITGNINYGTSIFNSKNYGYIRSTGKNANNQAICGGIVGQATFTGDHIIQNCKNYGIVSSEYYACGGIAGWIQKGTISNCENQGNVTTSRRNVGGIVGIAGRYDDAAKTKATIENCINKGNIEQTLNTTGCANTGGIAGVLNNGSTITQSVNIGNVTSHGYYATDTAINKSSRTAGICGLFTVTGANSISYCYNMGTIKGDYRAIGGIIGYTQLENQKVEYCYSTGNVIGPTGVLNIGGIIGYKNAGTVVNNGYYLENTVIDTNGNSQANMTALGEVKKETEIKGITVLDIWKNYFKNDYIQQINKGFPILSWQ